MRLTSKSDARAETLSARENEVIRLMSLGQDVSEIAYTMGISRETVKTYRKRIYLKLGVNKKSQCIKKAKELGLFND